MGRKIVLGGAGLALLLVVMFIALPAYGLMAPISLEELVKGSSHIVIGKAADITCRWADPWTEEEDFGIYTYVTLSVDEYIKGKSVGDSLVIKFAGGMMEIPVPDKPGIFVPPPLQRSGLSEGILRQWVWEFSEEDIRRYRERGWDTIPMETGLSDQPSFMIGQRELLFLKKGESDFGGKPVFSLYWGFMAKYIIVGDRAIPDNGNGSPWWYMPRDFLKKWGIVPEEWGYEPPDPEGGEPLEELLDRIKGAMQEQMGVGRTSWGEVKFLFLLAIVRRSHQAFAL